MSEALTVSVELIDDKVRFSATTRQNPAVVMDYFPPLGEGLGYTGLELLLTSLAGCSATAVVFLLRRMNRTVTGLRVHGRGEQRETRPCSFRAIALEFEVHSPDATAADMQKVFQMAEESYCPVWDMVRGNVEITPTFRLVTAG